MSINISEGIRTWCCTYEDHSCCSLQHTTMFGD